jgi:hypothetical protein
VLEVLSEKMLRLMGYARGSYSLGFVDGGADPITAVRPDLAPQSSDDLGLDAVKGTLA